MGFPAIWLCDFFFYMVVTCRLREDLTELRSKVPIIHAFFPNASPVKINRSVLLKEKMAV
jgi:hypothetical protein